MFSTDNRLPAPKYITLIIDDNVTSGTHVSSNSNKRNDAVPDTLVDPTARDHKGRGQTASGGELCRGCCGERARLGLEEADMPFHLYGGDATGLAKLTIIQYRLEELTKGTLVYVRVGGVISWGGGVATPNHPCVSV
ncbi:hypothetical protein J6590_067996 [Homalodisca vitripennis]|nr:hypothetical protein J6590_067996 [Homalodisca vitripennis]